MTQLLCLKLYRLRLFIQVNVLFFKRTSGLHKKNLSNQLSNSSPNFGLGLSNRSSRQNPKLYILNLKRSSMLGKVKIQMVDQACAIDRNKSMASIMTTVLREKKNGLQYTFTIKKGYF